MSPPDAATLASVIAHLKANGWAVVPSIATPAMVEAAYWAAPGENLVEVWGLMVRAAPTLEEGHNISPAEDEEIEVVVTEAMLTAGQRELALFNSDFECPSSAVERVFLAMLDVGLESGNLALSSVSKPTPRD